MHLSKGLRGSGGPGLWTVGGAGGSWPSRPSADHPFIDAAVASTFGLDRFVTSVFAELCLRSGRLCWHNAGHPAPLLLRGGRVAKALETEPGLPLGLGGDVESVWQQLEPGDRVPFLTDGVVEARSAAVSSSGNGGWWTSSGVRSRAASRCRRRFGV